MDRDAFLACVSRATASAQLPRPAAPRPAPAPRDDDLVAMFTAALEAVDGVMHTPATQAEIPAVVVGLLADCGAQRVLAWEEGQLPVPGVVGAVRSAGVELVDHRVPREPEGRTTHQAGYGTVDAGITGALAGFARSGSVVLTAGGGRPRMASLIPSVHIALLPAGTLYPSVSDWAAGHTEVVLDTSNLVFITGPSRTGDIEMALTLGVHGPRTMHVVLVPER